MHSNIYHDRGIIKWAPFDALVGYHSMLKELKYRLGKQNKPVLSIDQYDELNQKLQLAFNQKLEVEIEFFNHGYMKYTYGNILKIDFINKVIILSNYEKILADNVFSINVLAK